MSAICPEFIGVLERASEKNTPITIIIQSGANCCEHTGCVGEIVGDCFLTLISGNDACRRTFIPLDCICAIIDPADGVAAAEPVDEN
ncbi:MAG: hypothetical protein ACOC2G_00185 [Bacillota bacterium]